MTKTYFTGKPCKRGHVARRYVTSRACAACCAERCREWQALNRRKYLTRQNEMRRFRLFGLTPEKYHAMLGQQGGGCAICGGLNRSGGRALAVDHDHTCCPSEKSCGGCVRGLLCDNCNQGLGNFKDSATALRRAAEYVSR